MNEKTQTSIKDAAISLFQEKGLQNVTIKDICKKASCSNSTFYYHFGSMDGLLQNFTDPGTVINVDVLGEALSMPTAWGKLWRIHRAYTECNLRFGALLAWPLITMVSDERKNAKYANMRKMTELILPIVRQGQQSGEIRNQSPCELLANTVGLTMTGVLYQWYVSNGEIDLLKSMKTELSNLYDLREDLRD